MSILGIKQSAEDAESIEDAAPGECMLGSGGKFWVEALRTGSVQDFSLYGRVALADILGNPTDHGDCLLQSIGRYRFDIDKKEPP